MTQSDLSTRIRNLIIAFGAIAISFALFFGLQSDNPSLSLEKQAETSTPLEVALGNNKPTFLEFYANWCTSCQAMAEEIGELKEKYRDNINFVMLNVDNDKWLPEMVQYKVDGIPHFAFLDREGSAIASVIGEQPQSVLDKNLQALEKNETLPYQVQKGETSQVNSSNPPQKSKPDIQPRSHSN
ncbi:redoxin domain-containing protein [Euhalothece natronophila Z-M001]|uniref:Redoxin domain-containing protein n=1 Tax=Euhalothece natronophila Z-M001 TaxID=522448 RepID=A0A5B8NKR7_9CHRO|nr:thioredoxin family protein [Euhalothece natronophila]QDZ39586.1 redoxin domain-containing protein [Euhalothece natronophila Z-M001]